MTNSATVAGSAPAPMGFLARFLGVITSPRDTFAAVAASPKWLAMLAVTSLIVALFTALPMTTEAGKQATIDQQVKQMKSFGFDVTDQMYDNMERGAARLPYTTAISVFIVSPIFAVIIAGLLFTVFNAGLGGEASFKQMFATLAHAGVISALSAVFSGVINYFRGSVAGATNLGALLPMLPEQSFIGNLFGAIDIFLIWYVVVLAIGLAVLYRRRTQPIAISLLGVYAVIALIIAVVKSRMGGA